MTSRYTSKQIKTIDELIEHIRQNVGMYVGGSETPLHLFEECFTNSIDEALAGYSNIIAIKIGEDNSYHIIDNGRGIPIENEVPISISTKFSGAKFQHSKSAYKICSGKHGAGLVVVNALSLWYQIEIYRDGKYAYFRFDEGKLIDQKIENFNDKAPFSTKISFKPDPKFFDKERISIDDIKSRSLVASVEIQDCSLVVQDNGNREVISHGKMDYFREYCLSSDNDTLDIIHLQSTDKDEKFEAIFCWSKDGPLSQKVLSSVNVLPVIDGGTHVNVFNEIIRDVLVEKGKKLNYRFQPLDTQVRLRSYISCYLLHPDFGAQSKDKLTNRKDYFDKLYSRFKKEFENYLDKNQEVLTDLLNQFQTYRRSLDSKKLRGNTTKRSSTKLTKLQDCKSRNGELFIVEGDSAGGTIAEVRDPNIHAILPLKGKIPSVINKKEDIVKNHEISELITALGCGYGPEFDINKLRYDKVIALADSDPDGNHIASLLTIALATLVPEVIRQGRYYIARTPLRAINDPKKGKFIPLWSKEDYDKSIEKKQPVTYFKGLGELNGEQLEICALDPSNRKLIQVDYSEKIKEIMLLFSDVNKKRELLEDENIKLLE